VYILSNYFKIKQELNDKTVYFKRICKEAGVNYYLLKFLEFIKRFDFFNLINYQWLFLLKPTSCGATTYFIKSILDEAYGRVIGKVISTNKEIDTFINSLTPSYLGIELYNEHFKLPLMVYNHTFIVEKASTNLFIMYQSFASFYDLETYLNKHKHFYSADEIKKFFIELGELSQNSATDESKQIFKKWFKVDLDFLGKVNNNDKMLVKMVLIEKS
jgi:hypothetical protein